MIEMLAHTVLQNAHLDEIVFLGNADSLYEVSQCGRWIAAAAHASQCSEPRIVPAANDAVFDQLLELTLAGQRISEV